MKIISIIFATLVLQVKFVTAQLPVLSDSIYSNILKESRDLRIILPGEYKEGSGQRYEVLYILDGEWYQELVPNIYNFAQSAGYVPTSIFVLIRNRYDHGRNLRDRDFSPTQINNDSSTGGADRFYDFLTKEVVPYIENKYPVTTDRALLGSSFSGLFSVYAFLKDPAFFQSYVASDPNINFDKHYVTRIAAQTLKHLPLRPGTLWIGGRSRTYREGGIAGLDSIFRLNAPSSLHWQFVAYDNETHYSVQHKAFYDGLRFSHFGFGMRVPEFHPMNGIIGKNKPITLYFLNENPSAHYTIDGSEPSLSSPVMQRDDTVSFPGQAELRVKTFAYQSRDVLEWKGNFTEGKITPTSLKNEKQKPGFIYYVFPGKWNKIPELAKSKPSRSDVVDATMKLNSLIGMDTGVLRIEGTFEVPEEAYYVFYISGADAAQLQVSGQLLINDTSAKNNNTQSFATPLSKGKYSIQLLILHQTGGRDLHFSILHTTSTSNRWWENRLIDW